MATPPPGKLFWTVQEAATYLSMHPNTIYDWIRQARGEEKKFYGISKLMGKPPPYRMFGRNKILIPAEAFKAWVADPSNNQDNRCSA